MSSDQTRDPAGDDRPRILVIEDDPDVITLLREILEHEGFEVMVADDGLTGLLKLRGEQPDVTLLDIMMPNVNGVRVLEQLREEGDGTVGRTVIVITGSPEGAAESRTILGRDDVFEKPFDPDRLVARIRTHLAEA